MLEEKEKELQGGAGATILLRLWGQVVLVRLHEGGSMKALLRNTAFLRLWGYVVLLRLHEGGSIIQALLRPC